MELEDERPLPQPENFEVLEVQRDTAQLYWDSPADERQLQYE